MKLRELLEASDDKSELPQQTMEALTKELQELAKDETKEYSNALAVVHDAFQICNVERPTPYMRGAWKQYETLITQAVQYLAKYRPDGNWRITTADSKNISL